SSLVSRTAASVSTGTFQAQTAARTWLRASPAAARPVASRTRYACSSAARAGAMVFIDSLKAGLEQAHKASTALRLPGRHVAWAIMLLLIAARIHPSIDGT